MYTDLLRKQHAEILQLVGQLEGLLGTRIDAKAAEQARGLLVSLTGKVSNHLAAEDRVLYPRLTESANSQAADASKRFAKEMGEIGVVFRGYVSHYPSADAIVAQGAKFVADTKQVFAVLGKRIDVEEKVLYPMADAL